ncbi:MAG: lamin tail domain-containing protein, partial [Patescibacteria group bacterium]
MKITLRVTVFTGRFLMFTVLAVVSFAIFLFDRSSMAEGNLANHIVISEVRIDGGQGKATDEFIELYNPTDADLDISGWKIAKLTKSAASNEYDNIVSSTPIGTVIKTKGHLLIAHFDYTSVDNLTPDIVYDDNSFSANNTALLFDGNGAMVDLVGWEEAKNFEGGGPAPTSTDAKPSIERLPGGVNGNGADSDNNNQDFILAVSTPQNGASATTPVVDPELPTDAALVPNESLIINEFLPNPATGTEWVELYNFGSSTTELAGWTLSDGIGVVATLSSDIDAHGYLVVDLSGSQLNNIGGDAVILKNAGGKEIDKARYGDFEGVIATNAPAPEKGNTLARSNYTDTDNDKNDFA